LNNKEYVNIFFNKIVEVVNKFNFLKKFKPIILCKYNIIYDLNLIILIKFRPAL